MRAPSSPIPTSSRRSPAAPASVWSTKATWCEAQDTTGIVIITQVRPISVFFSLPQQDLPELNKGLAEGPLPVDALGADGKTPLDSGKVLVIDNQVDQTTGTVKLKAEFPNANLQLWPGQFVNVRVLIDTLRQVVVVPTAAIQRGPNGTFVYVVKDDSTRHGAAGDAHAAGRRAGGGRAAACKRASASSPPVLPASTEGTAGGGIERGGRRAGRPDAASGRNARQARRARASAVRARAGRRANTHERVLTLHPPPDRDLAARGRGPAGRHARLSLAAGVVAAAGRFSRPSRSRPSCRAPAPT